MRTQKDNRPDPKPRKHPQLWQSYLWWNELVEMRKRHTLRISSIEAGKSNLDAQVERDKMRDLRLDAQIEDIKKVMMDYGSAIGPVWDWITSIKGLSAGSLAAQLLAQFDDVSKFDTVSKFWRLAGWGLYEYWVKGGKIMAPRDGYKFRKAHKGDWVKGNELCISGAPGGRLAKKGEIVRCHVIAEPKDGWKLEKRIDVCLEGWCAPYSRKLKSICWLIAEQFIRQQTPGYVDIYYAEKDRQRKLHPEPIKVNGKWKYNDGHLHNRAKRLMIKIFLQHLYIKWREFEGLPISEPYVKAVMGHTNTVEPFGT